VHTTFLEVYMAGYDRAPTAEAPRVRRAAVLPGRPLEATFLGVFPSERLWRELGRRVGQLRQTHPGLGRCHVWVDGRVARAPRVAISLEGPSHHVRVEVPGVVGSELSSALDSSFEQAGRALRCGPP
jgi:hypothetical protein